MRNRTVGILKDTLLLLETAAFAGATACGISGRNTASPCVFLPGYEFESRPRHKASKSVRLKILFEIRRKK